MSEDLVRLILAASCSGSGSSPESAVTVLPPNIANALPSPDVMEADWKIISTSPDGAIEHDGIQA
jgi:hypothetical protein